MEKLKQLIEQQKEKEFMDCFEEASKDPSFDMNKSFSFKGSTHNLFSYACVHGCLEVCKYLLSKGIDTIPPRTFVNHMLPLPEAVVHGQFHVADWLQDEFGINCGISESFPLRMSIFCRSPEGVKYSLENGANPNAAAGEPMRHAVRLKFFPAIESLLDHGADPIFFVEGETLLEWLVRHGQYGLALKAIERGADERSLSDEAREKLKTQALPFRMAKKRKL